MKTLFRVFLAACTLVGLPSGAQTPVQPAPTSFVFEEVATLAPAQVLGDTALGRRQSIPITGGTFSGSGLSGRIVPGGADNQTVRSDGSVIVDATYMLETDDHVFIQVHNVGLIVPPRKGSQAYAWAIPTFNAPTGRYGWLNDALFISSIGPAGDKAHPSVRIRIWKVGQ
ncbi:MAG TPA: DUF3237 family protein [Steroidobacteraceae bacterium]|nr:DUF3237 family protein [Steroidobacteraceae bacterium]